MKPQEYLLAMVAAAARLPSGATAAKSTNCSYKLLEIHEDLLRKLIREGVQEEMRVLLNAVLTLSALLVLLFICLAHFAMRIHRRPVSGTNACSSTGQNDAPPRSVASLQGTRDVSTRTNSKLRNKVQAVRPHAEHATLDSKPSGEKRSGTDSSHISPTVSRTPSSVFSRPPSVCSLQNWRSSNDVNLKPIQQSKDRESPSGRRSPQIIELFECLTEASRKMCWEQMRRKHFKAGEVILERDTIGTVVCYVETGNIHFTTGEVAEELTHGDFFGLEAFVHLLSKLLKIKNARDAPLPEDAGSRHNFHLRALTDCTCLVLSIGVFVGIVEGDVEGNAEVLAYVERHAERPEHQLVHKTRSPEVLGAKARMSSPQEAAAANVFSPIVAASNMRKAGGTHSDGGSRAACGSTCGSTKEAPRAPFDSATQHKMSSPGSFGKGGRTASGSSSARGGAEEGGNYIVPFSATGSSSARGGAEATGSSSVRGVAEEGASYIVPFSRLSSTQSYTEGLLIASLSASQGCCQHMCYETDFVNFIGSEGTNFVVSFSPKAGMIVTDAFSASPLKGGVPPFRNSKRERGLHEAFSDEGAGSLAGRGRERASERGFLGRCDPALDSVPLQQRDTLRSRERETRSRDRETSSLDTFLRRGASSPVRDWAANPSPCPGAATSSFARSQKESPDTAKAVSRASSKEREGWMGLLDEDMGGFQSSVIQRGSGSGLPPRMPKKDAFSRTQSWSPEAPCKPSGFRKKEPSHSSRGFGRTASCDDMSFDGLAKLRQEEASETWSDINSWAPDPAHPLPPPPSLSGFFVGGGGLRRTKSSEHMHSMVRSTCSSGSRFYANLVINSALASRPGPEVITAKKPEETAEDKSRSIAAAESRSSAAPAAAAAAVGGGRAMPVLARQSTL